MFGRKNNISDIKELVNPWDLTDGTKVVNELIPQGVLDCERAQARLRDSPPPPPQPPVHNCPAPGL